MGVAKKEVNCKMCGTLFTANSTGCYCSEECKIKAKIKRNKLYNETKSKMFQNLTLEKTLQELTEYNKKHGTCITYGQYQVMKGL